MTDLPHFEKRASLPAVPVVCYDGMAVLLGGGAVDEVQFARLAAGILSEGVPLVVADGGADRALGLGLVPDWLIGDLDSASLAGQRNARNVLHISDQYSTDFEKVLASVRADRILAFGFLGLRLDHSLASLHVLAKVALGGYSGRVVLIDRYDAVVFCLGNFSAFLPPLSRLSIWPLGVHRFASSRGLRWPLGGVLDGVALEAGRMIGTSNEVLGAGSEGEDRVFVEIISASGSAGGSAGGSGYFVLVDGAYAESLFCEVSLP